MWLAKINDANWIYCALKRNTCSTHGCMSWQWIQVLHHDLCHGNTNGVLSWLFQASQRTWTTTLGIHDSLSLQTSQKDMMACLSYEAQWYQQPCSKTTCSWKLALSWYFQLLCTFWFSRKSEMIYFAPNFYKKSGTGIETATEWSKQKQTWQCKYQIF